MSEYSFFDLVDKLIEDPNFDINQVPDVLQLNETVTKVPKQNQFEQNYLELELLIKEMDEEPSEYTLEDGEGLLYIDKSNQHYTNKANQQQSSCCSSSNCMHTSDTASYGQICSKISQEKKYQAPSSSHGRKSDAMMKEHAFTNELRTWMVSILFKYQNIFYLLLILFKYVILFVRIWNANGLNVVMAEIA
jgi:hypothetical protein